ncbi:MAG: hypothetical protein Q9161_007705 [Pseudevernia consocians]
MPALPVTQQSDWSSNFYVVATNRIFVVIGMAYLVKSLYSLVPSIWGTSSASIAAAVADGIDLEDVTSNAPVTVPDIVDTSPDIEADLTLDLHPPQSSHDPQNHTERSRVNARAQNQGMEVPGSPTVTHSMQEQDVGVRDGDPHVDEEMDVSVDLTD